MKLLMLVPNLPLDLKNIKGGIHSAVLNLLEGFINQDICVKVISFNKHLTDEHNLEFSENIQILYRHEGPYSFQSLNYLFNCSVIVKKYIKEFVPDLVHFEEGNAFLFIRVGMCFPETRQVLTVHGMTFYEGRMKKKYKDKVIWFFNGLAQYLLIPKNIIHISKYSFAKFQDQNVNFQTVIPNAVVSNFFELPIKRIASNKLLYIGVIDSRKNLLFLLQSLNDLLSIDIHFHLDVIGDFTDNNYRSTITSYLKNHCQLNPYVHFNGWKSQYQVMEFIQDCDIVILPSKQETLPMAIAESMAAGKVVLASSVGGVPEMITSEDDGFLFDISVVDSLTSILINLYKNDIVSQQIAKRAKETAFQNFHCNVVASQTVDFYRQVLST